jgi:hypothetical protein
LGAHVVTTTVTAVIRTVVTIPSAVTVITMTANTVDRERRPDAMHFSMFAHPVIALIAGILILLVPRLLSYIVAIYLIITGILGLVR